MVNVQYSNIQVTFMKWYMLYHNIIDCPTKSTSGNSTTNALQKLSLRWCNRGRNVVVGLTKGKLHANPQKDKHKRSVDDMMCMCRLTN